MSQRNIKLAVAAFLDSPHARRLADVREQDARSVAETFLRVCYELLGAQPQRLDGEGLREALCTGMPGEFRRKDGLYKRVPEVLGAYLNHLEESEPVPQIFEMRLALERSAPDFIAAVEGGTAERRLSAQKQESVVHRADKLGRNDPCFCGSGRKFKKCHGKEA